MTEQWFRKFLEADGNINPVGQNRLLTAGRPVMRHEAIFDAIDLWTTRAPDARGRDAQIAFCNERYMRLATFDLYIDFDGNLKPAGTTLLAGNRERQPAGSALKALARWDRLSLEERAAIGRAAFAAHHKVAQQTFFKYVDANLALVPAAQAMLRRAGTSVPRSKVYEVLLEWHALDPSARANTTRDAFCTERGCSVSAFAQYVDVEGRIKPDGHLLLKREGKPLSKAYYVRVVTDWKMLPEHERRPESLIAFARVRGVVPPWEPLYRYIDRDHGTVTKKGEALVRGETVVSPVGQITATLLAWDDLPERERTAARLRTHIASYGLDWNAVKRFVHVDGGFTTRGGNRVKRDRLRAAACEQEAARLPARIGVAPVTVTAAQSPGSAGGNHAQRDGGRMPTGR
ncbi:hypothetical protein [Burkholderia ambifaria]|uniref:hypothetical protein n=1 Tax=Burkholderia ambifaria TaxID=152480 RepID=UPI001590883E|nr:hypothetical protein [Burkholderia ambifaria]